MPCRDRAGDRNIGLGRDLDVLVGSFERPYQTTRDFNHRRVVGNLLIDGFMGGVEYLRSEYLGGLDRKQFITLRRINDQSVDYPFNGVF